MDKIRKIIAWIWLNKERMVLFVVVGFLCVRVYKVVRPPDPEDFDPKARSRIPGTEIPFEITPPVAPGRPPTEIGGDYSGLYKRNPFWLHSGTKQATDDRVTVEDLGIELLAIREAGGRLRAQLKSRATTWWAEGAQFEEFEVIEINLETNTVVVYSEQFGKDFTLTLK